MVSQCVVRLAGRRVSSGVPLSRVKHNQTPILRRGLGLQSRKFLSFPHLINIYWATTIDHCHKYWEYSCDQDSQCSCPQGPHILAGETVSK